MDPNATIAGQARTLLQLRLESPLEVSVPLMAKKKKKESSLLKTLTHSYIFIWGGNHSFLLTSVSLLELLTYKQFFPLLPAPILIGKVPWNCP